MQYFMLLSDAQTRDFQKLASEREDEWIPLSAALPVGERGRATYQVDGAAYTLRHIAAYLSAADEIVVYVLGRAGGECLH